MARGKKGKIVTSYTKRGRIKNKFRGFSKNTFSDRKRGKRK